MYYQKILVLAVLTMVFTSSCKKDDGGDETINTSCTETREFWLDGNIDGQAFVTSEPCGDLRLIEDSVYQSYQGAIQAFQFISFQQIKDSTAAQKGSLTIYINAIVPEGMADTNVTGIGNVYSVSATNICNVMKLGTHYLFFNEAEQNNSNSYYLQYIDSIGQVWQPIIPLATDSSFIVTSLDGIVSQNPFSGAYFPYCTISFSYDLLMQQVPPTNDTISLKGTGRLGFR